jgi:hypothetical protein
VRGSSGSLWELPSLAADMGCAPTKADRYGGELASRQVLVSPDDGAVSPRATSRKPSSGAERHGRSRRRGREEGLAARSSSRSEPAETGSAQAVFMQYMPEVRLRLRCAGGVLLGLRSCAARSLLLEVHHTLARGTQVVLSPEEARELGLKLGMGGASSVAREPRGGAKERRRGRGPKKAAAAANDEIADQPQRQHRQQQRRRGPHPKTAWKAPPAKQRRRGKATAAPA